MGELRDLETISTALTAVETGHLVFATLHTQDAGSTVDRLIDVYPENQQQQIRVQVASTLRAVVVQTLIPRASGHGRAPATEVMINTPAVAALIRGGKAHQIRTVLQSGEKEGMHTLDQDLARLVNKGVITFEDALAKVQILEEFEKLCGAFNTWLVMPSETLFTSTLSDGNMQFIALTPSELFMPCVMSCLMWCFLIQICLRRKTASLLLTTYLGISVAFTAHLSMHHAGIILGFFIAILAIDCDIEKINSNDWPQWIRNLNNRVMTLLGPKKTERYLRFFKILGLIFMLVSVYWTASASICDIRYDYSSSRAVASFIKTNHLEQYRWMAGWTRVSKNDTASNPEINKIIDKGGYCGGTDCIDYTSWYGSALSIQPLTSTIRFLPMHTRDEAIRRGNGALTLCGKERHRNMEIVGRARILRHSVSAIFLLRPWLRQKPLHENQNRRNQDTLEKHMVGRRLRNLRAQRHLRERIAFARSWNRLARRRNAQITSGPASNWNVSIVRLCKTCHCQHLCIG